MDAAETRKGRTGDAGQHPAPADPDAEQLVLWAYRLLLGREPESDQVLQDYPYRDRRSLVRQFLASPEFASNNGVGPPASIDVATHEGFSIYAARDDQLIGSPVLHGSYEPHVTALFRQYLRLGMNVVDVGANVGHFTMLAASLVGPKGLVTAIEANPDNAKLLEASRRLNGFDQVKLVCAAAAQDVGVLLLNTDVSNGVTTEIIAAEQLWATRVTPCLPLRAVLPTDRAVDFIKIDIEGAEYGALLGCSEILRRDRPVIVSELSPLALPSVSGVDADVYLRFLLSCGLELATISWAGEVTWCGADADAVLHSWEATGADHIDIIAAPAELRGRFC